MMGGSGTKQVGNLPSPLPFLLGAFIGMLISPSFLFGQLTTLLPLFAPQEAVYCSGGSFAMMLSLPLPMFLGAVIGGGLAWLHLPTRQAYRMPETLVGVCRYLTVPLIFLAVGSPLALLYAGSSVCLSAAGVHSTAHALANPEVYKLSPTRPVRLYCTMSKKRTWDARLILDVGYGQTFTLALSPRSRFSSAQIWEVLRDRLLDTSGVDPGCPHELKRLLSAEAEAPIGDMVPFAPPSRQP